MPFIPTRVAAKKLIVFNLKELWCPELLTAAMRVRWWAQPMGSHCSPADLHCAPRKWNHENPYSGFLPICQTLGAPPWPWTDSDHLHHGIA